VAGGRYPALVKCLLVLAMTVPVLWAEDVEWSSGTGKGALETGEYDKVMRDYVEKKYPDRVKAFRQQQLKEARSRKAESRQTERRTDVVVSHGMMLQRRGRSFARLPEAVSYCAHLYFAGYSDWRLPHRYELETVLPRSSRSRAVTHFCWTTSGAVPMSGMKVGGNQLYNSYFYTHEAKCIRNLP
jgi:hypothetical protein